MKTEMVSQRMWVQGKMVPKCKLFKSIPLPVQELKCRKSVYDLKDHVGEEALNSNLPPKFGPIKKTPPIKKHLN
jgi:hypothetical protein